MNNRLYILGSLGVRFCLAPLITAILVGYVQQRLFLRDIPKVARWWTVMTVIGLFSGAIGGLGLLFILVASGWDLLVVFLVSICAFGIISSLCQVWLLGRRVAWEYIIAALLSSLVAGLVAFGVCWLLVWYNAPFTDPVAEGGFLLAVEMPVTVVILFIGFGIGTGMRLSGLRTYRQSVVH